MSRILYGIHPVFEALKHTPEQVRQVWYEPSREKALAKVILLANEVGVPVSQADRRTLDEKSKSQKHQGVACQADDFRYTSLREFLHQGPKRPRICVIADQIQDPQNIGGFLRAMGAFGADLLVVGKHRGATITPTVVKISAGGASVVQVARESSLPSVLTRLKKEGFWIFGLEADGASLLSDQDLSENIALIVGSEGQGLSRLIKERCDVICRLPQEGSLQSLNAAMALSCSLYEVARQRVEK